MLLDQVLQQKGVGFANYLCRFVASRLHRSNDGSSTRHPITIYHRKFVRISPKKFEPSLEVQADQTDLVVAQMFVVAHHDRLSAHVQPLD